MDSMHIPSTDFAEGVTGAQLIDFAKKAAAGGGMAIFGSHGVGADYLRVSDADHHKLIAWLAAHRSDGWVASQRCAGLGESPSGQGELDADEANAHR